MISLYPAQLGLIFSVLEIEVYVMGATGTEEHLEEIETGPNEVFSVITDLELARSWGQTSAGMILFPPGAQLGLGQIVEIKPKGSNYPCRLKVKIIRYGQIVELDIIEGPFFGHMTITLEPRPYGTLLTIKMDYRIERVGFRLRWSMSERKKFGKLMEEVLTHIKSFSESRANQ